MCSSSSLVHCFLSHLNNTEMCERRKNVDCWSISFASVIRSDPRTEHDLCTHTQLTQSMNILSTLQFDLTFLPSPTSYVQSTFRLSMSLTEWRLFALQLIVFSRPSFSSLPFVCFHFTLSTGLTLVYFCTSRSAAAACVRIDASKKSTWNELLRIHHRHHILCTHRYRRRL